MKGSQKISAHFGGSLTVLFLEGLHLHEHLCVHVYPLLELEECLWSVVGMTD